MSEESSNDKDSKICGLCNDNASKYSCPRCEIYYCSLDCYKSEKHQECSESFYRECVTEELASNQADDESKQKMIEILKRMQEQNIEPPEAEELIEHLELDSDDEVATDLHERVKDLNLNDPDALWGVLTEDERNEFEALLNVGDVGDIIPQWEPWWMYRKRELKVEDINKEEMELLKCPILKQVPPMASLTKIEPSQAVTFNISNVLAAYAFLMRYFNGDVEPLEWVTYFLDICDNLNSNTNFDDLEIAVESVALSCLHSQLIETEKLGLDIMKNDTYLILNGPSKENNRYYCKAALSDLHRILNDAKSLLKTKPASDDSKSKEKPFSKKFPEHGPEHLPKLDGDKVKKCIKKVEYYLSFLESYSMKFY